MKVRRYRAFSNYLEDIRFKNYLRKQYVITKDCRDTKIDIILPTFNRSALVRNAVDSILKQIHKNWHLYICDDGSTDNTYESCLHYIDDSRITYLKLPKKGVSAARNIGLTNSSSEFISFLDSDNTWDQEFLSLMISFMKSFSLGAAYCAAKLNGDNQTKWLGDFFNWQECAKQNYIDLNCFVIRSTYINHIFDERLKRYVDWDFILNNTKTIKTSYLSSPLVSYCNKFTCDRITTTVYNKEEQAKWIKYIQDKYQKSSAGFNNLDMQFTDSWDQEQCT